MTDLQETLRGYLSSTRSIPDDVRAAAGEAAAVIDALTASKDGAYEERNRCVALLVRLALANGWRAGLGYTLAADWEDDWRYCVYIDLPTGQVSWHYHESQTDLFDHLPGYLAEWDGHDTPEKYRRVAECSAHEIPLPGSPQELRSALMNARRAMIVSVTGISDGLTIHDIRGWIADADAALKKVTG